MIYLISQITFIFLTPTYYNMNFIALPSISSQDFPGTLRSIFTDCFWKAFFSTQKIHISEYVCKTCLKELRISLKCSETFEKFLVACNSSKNTGLSQFFFKRFWQLYFKNINFFTRKRCLHADFYEFETTWQRLTKISKSTFSKKGNPMKYPVQTYILMRTWNFLFMYFIDVSH